MRERKLVWMVLGVAAAGLLALAPLGYSQHDHGQNAAVPKPAGESGPKMGCGMGDMAGKGTMCQDCSAKAGKGTMCQDCSAKLDELAKSLESAKKAADSGDAKAASAEIDKAAALVKRMRENMKKMMAGAGPKVVVANAKCPMMGTDLKAGGVPESLVRDYKGQKVGFCCAGCPEQWDKLTVTEKDAKLASAG